MASAPASTRFLGRAASLVLAAAFALGACSGDAAEQADSTGRPDGADSGTATSGGLPEESILDCVRDNFPCTWDEASPEAVKRTDAVLQIASALLSQGGTVDDVAAAMAKAPDMVSVSHDPFGIMFRVEGGLPATVDFDPTGSDELLSGASQPPLGTDVPSLAQATGGAFFTTCANAQDPSDGEPGVTLQDGVGRKALLLSPWQHDLPWNLGAITDELLMPGSKYRRENGGSSTSRIAPVAGLSVRSGANVTPFDFCGWEQYDTIMLLTHGRALCESEVNGVRSGCLTSFHVGQYSENFDELTALFPHAPGVIVGIGNYGDRLDNLSPEQKEACDAALEEYVYPEGLAESCFKRLPAPVYTVKVTTKFFEVNYPDGLPDRLIFLAACQGMKLGDMQTVLHRQAGTGKIFGFDKVALRSDAQWILEEFATELGNNRRISGLFSTRANDHLHEQGSRPRFITDTLSDLPGGELGDLVTSDERPTWGSDPLKVMFQGEELAKQGAAVAAVTPAPEQGRVSLALTLVLTDVAEGETPEDFNATLWFNDEQLDLGDVSWHAAGDEGAYEADVVVTLPRTVEEGDKFDLEMRAVLPAADDARTTWKYEDVSVKELTACDRLTADAVSAAIGVPVTEIDAGDLGSFFGTFCGWSTADSSSQVTMLVYAGAGDSFRADNASSPLAVEGFGDVATFDPSTGRGDSCTSIEDFSTGTLQWSCFVNATVAFGDDTLYFTVEGNVVGENGPADVLASLQDLVSALRS